MSRLSLSFSTRAFVVAAIVGTLVLAALPAWAQEPKQPVIDSSPWRVLFKAEAVIKGHLENGVPGDVVDLERRKPGRDWKTIGSREIDEEQKVGFSPSPRVTADYRLSYTDPATELQTTSDVATVRVKPRLRVDTSPSHVLKGRWVKLTGSLYPKVAGRRVVLQKKVAGEWRFVAKTTVKDGRFSSGFRARRPGYRRVRAVFRGDGHNTRARNKDAARVYRRSWATWYGPGFYGNGTACGQRLTTETLGVAHRSLPCGTKVSILYQGRTISVPVIDRGPYGTYADYDLTKETADRLRFSGTDRIGVTVSS